MKRPWGGQRDSEPMSDRASLERSARWWMRAYPRRWRVIFGEDFVGVLSDVAAPNTRRVPLREAAEIVRSGWALRLRERPPFWRWLGYRCFHVKLPEQYRFWVVDDLLGVLFGLRVGISNLMLLMPMYVTYWALMPEFSSGPMPILTVIALFTSLASVSVLGRRYQARQHWKRFIGTEPLRELQPRRYRRLLTEG